jgi:hypothetical protein
VHVIDGDRHVGDALDAVEPLPLPPVHASGLAAGQTEILDTDYEGDGPLPPELIGNEDPAPGIP